MKAQDLRIGNLVLCQKTNEPCHVALINGYNPGVIGLTDIPHGYYFDDHITTIEGIPINPDALIKLGFTKEGHRYWAQDYQDWFRFTKDGRIWNACVYNTHYGCGYHKKRNDRMLYIHQLQNLFYAHTGEELTFNL